MTDLIYPKFETLSLPDNIVNYPILGPMPYLQYTLSEDVCNLLMATLNTFGKDQFYPVSTSGKQEAETLGKGSVRLTNYDVNFAQFLTEELSPYVPAQLRMNKYTPCDWESQNPEEYNVWNFMGISPLFRYMKYTKDSWHVPHYDASHYNKEDPLLRTLYSGVLYLTTNKSGATAFVNDKQAKVPFKDRNKDDWTRQAEYSEVNCWSLPSKGKIIIFPHGACHSVFPLLEDEERIIVRFDLFYSAYSKA